MSLRHAARHLTATVRLLLAFMLAVPAPHSLAYTQALLAAVGAAASIMVTSDADARSRAKSSSGSSGSSRAVRSPSSSDYSAPRTPSYSSTRPAAASSTTRESAGDRAINRQNSANALDAYRTSTARPSSAKLGATPNAETSSNRPAGRTPSVGQAQKQDYNYGYNQNSIGTGRGFGNTSTEKNYGVPRTNQFIPQINPALLWFLFSSLNRPDYVNVFHNNTEDPGYQEWRQEAERRAQTDPAVGEKLKALDTKLASMADQPRVPGQIPSDVPSNLLQQTTQPTAASLPDDENAGDGYLFWLVVVGGAIYLLVHWHGKRKRRAGNTPSSKNDNSLDVSAHSGVESAEPNPRYRLGQIVTVDPSPFLLAGGAIAAQLPTGAGADGRLSAQSVSVLTAANNSFERLYLDDFTYLQLHVDPQEAIDECRLFTVIDEITPVDQTEWANWLNEKTGVLGAAEFIMPDGAVYGRVWAPSNHRVPPIQFQEFQLTLQEEGQRREKALYLSMLYRRETGLPEPAPAVEYRLVSVVESKGEAWIEIAAGIDINPTSLSLV